MTQIPLVPETPTRNHDALPALPYAGKVPAVDRDTSKAAAEQIDVGPKQAQVLLALLKYGPLSDEALDRVTKALKPMRPRRREMELAGLVEDSGDRVTGETGMRQILWALTKKGEKKARELSEATE